MFFVSFTYKTFEIEEGSKKVQIFLKFFLGYLKSSSIYFNCIGCQYIYECCQYMNIGRLYRFINIGVVIK